MKENIFDSWKWIFGHDNGYSAKDGYNILIHEDHLEFKPVREAVWNKTTLLKMSIFVWKLINNKISSKNNLARREIILSNLMGCTSACDHEEICIHLFFNASILDRFVVLFNNGWGSRVIFPITLENMLFNFVDTIPSTNRF